LEAYSRREITLYDDKIIALLGLGQETARVLGDELVDGILRQSMWQDLLWRVDHNARQEERNTSTPRRFSLLRRICQRVFPHRPQSSLTFPSWCWASVKAPIQNFAPLSNRSTKSCIEVISIDQGVLRLKGKISVPSDFHKPILPESVGCPWSPDGTEDKVVNPEFLATAEVSQGLFGLVVQEVNLPRPSGNVKRYKRVGNFHYHTGFLTPFLRSTEIIEIQ
jgi:hypothetical protein